MARRGARGPSQGGGGAARGARGQGLHFTTLAGGRTARVVFYYVFYYVSYYVFYYLSYYVFYYVLYYVFYYLLSEDP